MLSFLQYPPTRKECRKLWVFHKSPDPIYMVSPFWLATYQRSTVTWNEPSSKKLLGYMDTKLPTPRNYRVIQVQGHPRRSFLLGLTGWGKFSQRLKWRTCLQNVFIRWPWQWKGNVMVWLWAEPLGPGKLGFPYLGKWLHLEGPLRPRLWQGDSANTVFIERGELLAGLACFLKSI